MRLVFSTVSISAAGTWSGGDAILVENVGLYNGTAAGKTLAPTESLELKAGLNERIEFDYDSTSTTFEFTVGVRCL